MPSPIPPTPPKDPILGHLRFIRKDVLGFYLRAFRDYGDVVRLFFGRTSMYLLAHPDHIKYVVQENAKNFEKKSPGYTKLRELFGNGLVTSDGDEWRRQRRIAQPAFHRERIEGFAKVMTRAAADMLDAWRPREGTTFDVSVEMTKVTQRIVSETLLGTDAPEGGEEVGSAIAFLLGEIVRRQWLPVALPLSVPTEKNRRFVEQLALVDRVVYGAIEERRRAKGPRTDLLSMIMDAKDDETGTSHTDKELRDQLLTIFVAGHETTAAALNWTLYFLSLHPEIRRDVRDEVRAVVGTDGAPTMADLPKMPLLERVLKESMRLKPPITRVGRRVAADDVVGGYPMAAGSFLVLAPYVTHRHPAFWDNPEGFDPDRFLPENDAKRPRYAYFPFLGGPRQCIGNVFATVEALIILSMILARYDLDLVPGHPIEHEDTFSLRQKYGMKVLLRRVA